MYWELDLEKILFPVKNYNALETLGVSKKTLSKWLLEERERLTKYENKDDDDF